MLKNNEKFFAFCLLGFGVMLLAVLAYIYPPEDGTGAQRIIDAAMGGMTLALGSAVNALFRIREPGERTVEIDQPENRPVPVAETPHQ